MANKTYADLITAALRLIGIKAQGQRASGSEAVDALDVLNELIDAWNSYVGLLFSSVTQVFPLNGGSTYTIGPTGNFQVTPRPTKLTAAWLRSGNTDIPLNILSDIDYGLIAQKSEPGQYPNSIFLDAAVPNSTIHIYPVQANSGSLVLSYRAPLLAVELSTPENLPPAYRQALRYNLACALAPEYGIDPPGPVQLTALTSKAMIINANASVPLQRFGDLRRFNINLGN